MSCYWQKLVASAAAVPAAVVFDCLGSWVNCLDVVWGLGLGFWI